MEERKIWQMKIVVGLGNPGEKYKKSRHNVGFMVVDELAREIINFQLSKSSEKPIFNFQKNKNLEIFKLSELVFVKPQTFMNRSGEAVAKVLRYFSNSKSETLSSKLNGLYVIHDDLDISLGKFKIQKGKGPKVHNGLNSIYEKLGSKDFWHVRIGVDNRHQETLNPKSEILKRKITGEKYVLQRFSKDEKLVVKKVIKEVVRKLKDVLA